MSDPSSFAAPPGGYDPAASWRSAGLRLVRRVTMGVAPEEALRVRTLGYQGYLEHQLNPEAIDDSAVEAFVAGTWPLLALDPAALRALHPGEVRSALVEATLYRSIYSRRQLHARMVEFWTDHFNIDHLKVGGLKGVDDRTVIRPHALGRFPDMLRASAHSPAMLHYLDNTNSRGTNPNLNYARELMELHTLGVDGGYTPDDVREVARCFTGWTFVRQEGPEWGRFVFNPRAHDNGLKTVLGQTIPAGGGIRDGETVLEILIRHPSTARFIAKKLARWMFAENPPASLVQSVATTYTKTGGDIRAMLRTLLGNGILAAAPPKYKRPYHLVVSALRATRPAIAGFQSLRYRLRAVGQPPFEWDPPDGYPDRLDYWAANLLPRWNFAFALLNGGIQGVTVDTSAFENLASGQTVASRINLALFAGEMAPRERAELVAYLRPDPPARPRVRDAVALALAAPGFQWY